MTIERINPGDKSIPADSWARMADAASLVLDRRDVLSNVSTGASGTSTVAVKNLTGVDLGRFSIVGLDGFVYDPAQNLSAWKNGAVLKAVTPSIERHYDRFAVLQTALRKGQTGPALIEGPTVCRVSFDDESGDLAAGPIHGETGKLIAGYGSARIISKFPGSGEQWAYVRLGTDAGRRWQIAYNSGATALPAYGLVSLIVAETDRLSATPPLKLTVTGYYAQGAVGPSPIPAGGYGLVTTDWPAWVLTENVSGRYWGPTYDDSCTLQAIPDDASVGPTETEGGFWATGAPRSNPVRRLAFFGDEWRMPRKIAFTLDDDLTTADQFVAATITDHWDGGPPIGSSGPWLAGATVLLANAAHDDGDYIFAAPAGTAGQATRDWPVSQGYSDSPAVAYRIDWVRCVDQVCG